MSQKKLTDIQLSMILSAVAGSDDSLCCDDEALPRIETITEDPKLYSAVMDATYFCGGCHWNPPVDWSDCYPEKVLEFLEEYEVA